MNSRLFVGSDASFIGSLYVANDVNIRGRLNVQQYQASNIINTTTTNYSIIVSEDMSLNGRLWISGDTSLNGNIFVNNRSILDDDVSMNYRLFVSGDASFNGSANVGGNIGLTGFIRQFTS